MSTVLFVFLMTGGIGFLFMMLSLILGDIFKTLDLNFGTDFKPRC